MALANSAGLAIQNSPKDFTDPNTPHDRVIVVEDQKLYVFSGHLSFCSEFFLTMFTSNFKEKDQEEIVIEELDADDFHEFLQTLAPGGHSLITADNYGSILTCARRFIVPEVVSLCMNFVVTNYNNLDKFDLLEVAFKHDWIELKEKVAELIIPVPFEKEFCPNGCQTGYIPIAMQRGYYCARCGLIKHTKQEGHLDKTSFLVQNEEKISALPNEIQAFILSTLLKKLKE